MCLLSAAGLFVLSLPVLAQSPCIGSGDGDSSVTVEEITMAVDPRLLALDSNIEYASLNRILTLH